MEGFGAVYIIETAQQFWSELEEILHVPPNCTLTRLDAALKSFIALCSSYHEQFLQSPLQLEHSCDQLLTSELFVFHSERMCDILLEDAERSTDPHSQFVISNILLSYGRRNSNFLRSHKRWKPLIPLLMDHVRVEVDPDVEDTYALGSASGSSSGMARGLAMPIEAKLRTLSVRLLYEVLRVQKLSLPDLDVFGGTFIGHLFELVEQTRHHRDETFNYAIIKFLVALNEQFMLASLPDTSANQAEDSKRPDNDNRVLLVLMSRLNLSTTFGENMIFMLNRADRSPEDRVMQLLILKLLYLLFTTPGTSEYFYTNDLCVLVDVFLREIVDLDESNESLRHTFLRVLHPLLTKTQLRTMPYKRPQIVHVLEALISNQNIREINPTTKRLVQRCLGGEWCVQLLKTGQDRGHPRDGSIPDNISVTSAPSPTVAATQSLMMSSSKDSSGSKQKTLKSSKSVENFKSKPQKTRSGALAETYKLGTNDSSTSLPRVAAAAMPSPTLRPPPPSRRDRAPVSNETAQIHQEPQELLSSLTLSPDLAAPAASSSVNLADTSPSAPPRARTASPRRAAPAPPPHRRKPPAIPAHATPKIRALVSPPPSPFSLPRTDSRR